jgi:acylphosphatase
MVEQARTLGVRGWVRNRIDGSVEALIVGDPVAVERLVLWAQRGPRGARVAALTLHAHEARFEDFAGFDQRPTE